MIGNAATALGWAVVLTLLGAMPAEPTALTAITALAVAILLVTGAADRLRIGRVPGPEPAVRALAVRRRAERSVVVRLRDPDAAGHPRPRAPGASPSGCAASLLCR